MSVLAEYVARLRVAATTGTIAPEVARWAAETIEEVGAAAERVAARNRLLREAASLVSGSTWAKARRLEREVKALAAHPALRERALDDGVRDLVAEALDAAPAPQTARHLYRIIRDD